MAKRQSADAAPTRTPHPEAQPGEVWIGNIFRSDFPLIGWQTKRLGEVGYFADGPVITSGNKWPVFVSREELEAAGIDLTGPGPFDHRWRDIADDEPPAAPDISPPTDPETDWRRIPPAARCSFCHSYQPRVRVALQSPDDYTQTFRFFCSVVHFARWQTHQQADPPGPPERGVTSGSSFFERLRQRRASAD
jgi:hypothetical protein